MTPKERRRKWAQSEKGKAARRRYLEAHKAEFQANRKKKYLERKEIENALARAYFDLHRDRINADRRRKRAEKKVRALMEDKIMQPEIEQPDTPEHPNLYELIGMTKEEYDKEYESKCKVPSEIPPT